MTGADDDWLMRDLSELTNMCLGEFVAGLDYGDRVYVPGWFDRPLVVGGLVGDLLLADSEDGRVYRVLESGALDGAYEGVAI